MPTTITCLLYSPREIFYINLLSSLGNNYKTIINIVIIILWNKLEKEIFFGSKHVWSYFFFPNHYVAIEESIQCDFNYMNLLMSHVTCLNNTHG